MAGVEALKNVEFSVETRDAAHAIYMDGERNTHNHTAHKILIFKALAEEDLEVLAGYKEEQFPRVGLNVLRMFHPDVRLKNLEWMFLGMKAPNHSPIPVVEYAA